MLFLVAILQMAFERSLTLRIVLAFQIVRHVFEHNLIGLDSLGLDRAAGRRVITRRRQADRAIVLAERYDRLHRSLAEGARADDRRALMILQGACDDFRRRSRAAIDENDERLAFRKIAGARIVALGFIGVAATGRNDLAMIEERVRNRDRLIEQTARVVAQIEDSP